MPGNGIQVLSLFVVVSMTASCGLVTSEVKAYLSSSDRRNSLHLRRHRNDRDHLAGIEIENRNRSRPDIRGVGAMAVMRDREHVRLLLPGWNRANNFQGRGIDNCDRLFQFGTDVEQSIFRSKNRKMRPDAFSEIKIANYFSRRNIDNHQVAAVSSRLANPGVPVNRDVCQLSIARSL